MKNLPIALTLCLCAACSSPEAKPDPKPVLEPVETQAPAVEDPPAEDASYVEYNYKDGRTRAYLPFTSPICQEDETAEPVYEVQALWMYDVNADQWKALDVAPDVPYRLACNAMLDLVNLLGYDLDPATYVVEAEIGGTTERDVFYVGDAECSDLDIEPPPAGQVALCVLSRDSAEPKFVPDPASLAK